MAKFRILWLVHVYVSQEFLSLTENNGVLRSQLTRSVGTFTNLKPHFQMKNIFAIGVLLLVFSCKNIEQKKLIGSWKMLNVIDQTGENVVEKTTFTKDSIIIEMYANKKLIERFSSSYKFDTVNNVIYYVIKKHKLKLKIMKLTDSEMEVLGPKTNNPILFSRAK